MKCPRCHANYPDERIRCPNCGQPADKLSGGPVLEPEIIDPGPPPTHQQPSQEGFTRIFYTTFPGRGTMASSGCTPFFISLGLTLAAMITYGFLAGIGFAFFTLLGRALTFMLTVRNLLQGRFMDPWVFHILTWVVSWFLVAWLSGGL